VFKAARFLSHLLLILAISLRKVNPEKPLISLEYLYLTPVRIHAGLSEILLNGSGHATPKLALLSVILLLLITAKYKIYINISAPLREQPKCRLAEARIIRTHVSTQLDSLPGAIVLLLLLWFTLFVLYAHVAISSGVDHDLLQVK
jgi:hypothetical protein